MFLVTVTRTAGPERVDPVRPEHGERLRDLIDRGLLPAAGRRTPDARCPGRGSGQRAGGQAVGLR
ncbi:hypothetical protein, partial [Kitasatospora sp. NPDC057198]|uniref:hypothetical protein n=1 Tax=Kitasatospora sp. NPDC057198 TaxID=3346046 RepID=UPI003639A1C6